MSDFPGAITKQIFEAPPRIRRSTRYSLTARGRSVAPSFRLRTGRSSFEKANGWMRVPAPAAGTIPHIVRRQVECWVPTREVVQVGPRGVPPCAEMLPAHARFLRSIAALRRSDQVREGPRRVRSRSG